MALLETEGLKLEFTREALEEMAQFAFRVNETTENIGARRLHTIMERVLDEISFLAPDLTKAQPQSEGNVLQLAAATDYGATVPTDQRAPDGEWDGEGSGHRSGICAPDGGVDREGSRFVAVYIVSGGRGISGAQSESSVCKRGAVFPSTSR